MISLWRILRKSDPFGPELRVSRQRRGVECQLSLSGRINIDSATPLRSLLLECLQSPQCRELTVDLYDVLYLDTSGLAVFVEVLKAAYVLGKIFQLTGLRNRPLYLLETTRLLHLFTQKEGQITPGGQNQL
ncbi:MAG: STAS domain-containing protein [Acidobacteriia bacterium]|nr:STAS domain-containing protein [Terriglobia bacterium]